MALSSYPPIVNIEQAKAFFLQIDCSHFHMARDFPERYEEYTRLNIPEKLEIAWRGEKLGEYYGDIVEHRPTNLPLWATHSTMYYLFETLRTSAALMTMLDATRQIRDRVPIRERVLVAETINGRAMRHARSGLIYISYDLGDIAVAKEFVDLSLHMAAWKIGDGRDKARCQKAAQLCNEIKNELRLW